MSWPPHKVDFLVKKMDAGWSARQIGVEILKSKNAVIGKANRMGLRFSDRRMTAPIPEEPEEYVPEFHIDPDHPMRCATDGCTNNRILPYKRCQHCKAKTMPERTRKNESNFGDSQSPRGRTPGRIWT